MFCYLKVQFYENIESKGINNFNKTTVCALVASILKVNLECFLTAQNLMQLVLYIL